MNPVWLPTAGGIVPESIDPSGPVQEEELFATLQRALEDALGEFGLRRLDVVDCILGELIPSLGTMQGARYALLAASALSLRGRLGWRRAEQAAEHANPALEQAERSKQDAAFQKAVELFRAHEGAIADHVTQSRLYTDYGIALFRLGDYQGAIRVLEQARVTGAAPAEAFGYLGLTHRELGAFEPAIAALKQALQLAPGDKVLLGTLAKTLDQAGKRSDAVRVYCQAAVAAGKDDDMASACRLLEAALDIQPDDAQGLSMLTLLLRSQGDDAAAAALLERTLQRFPTNPWALGLRAMLLRDEGDMEAAVATFGKAEIRSADLAWVWLEYAKTLAAMDAPGADGLIRKAAELLGEHDARVLQAKAQVVVQTAPSSDAGIGRATDLLRAAATSAPESPVIRKALGQLGLKLLPKIIELAKSQPDGAIVLLQKAVESFPERVEPREALARVLLQQKNYKDAGDVLDGALNIAPNSAVLFGLKATLFDQQGELAEAVRFYRRASRAAPEDDSAFGALIDGLTRAGRGEDALNELERKLAHFPENGPALAEKGRLLCAAGRLVDAVAALQTAEAVLEAPSDANLLLSVRITLGETLRRLDRYEEAHTVFERAIPLDNALCDAHAYKSVLLIDIAEYGAAAQLLADTITRFSPDPEDEAMRARLGWLWCSKGWALRFAGATQSELLDAFRTSHRLDPAEPYACKNLGWLLLREPGHEREGEQLLTQLVDGRAVKQVSMALVGWCYYLLRHYNAAEHWLRGALAAEPADITAQFDLALVLLAAGREDAAAEFARGAEQTRKKPPARQRGLFHIALSDLAGAAEEGRVDAEQGWRIWQDLRQHLRNAKFPEDKLDKLKYPRNPTGHIPAPALASAATSSAGVRPESLFGAD